MLYNLRSDIIYYKSGSDFELEFNLCGCCRMRLLTDKPSNKKAFVHSLARAVSRSRVILIAGPLFGQDSTIEIVAQALGTTTELVDNGAYNIASEDEIAIIKGSLPLVASDGSFGGCIIESGPQTMILLTDNKTLRKNIMTTLIHPYVSELYSAELKANSNEPTVVKEVTAPIEETIETSEETTKAVENNTVEELDPSLNETDADETKDEVIISDTIEENTSQDDNIDISDLFTNETIEEAPTDSNYIEDTPIIFEEAEAEEAGSTEIYSNAFKDLYLENQKEEANLNAMRQQPAGYQVLYDDGEVMENNADYSEGRTSRLNIATIIVTAILLLSIIAICYCIFSASSSEGMAPAEYIRSVWQTVFD